MNENSVMPAMSGSADNCMGSAEPTMSTKTIDAMKKLVWLIEDRWNDGDRESF